MMGTVVTVIVFGGIIVFAGYFLLSQWSSAQKTSSASHAATKAAERDLVGKALSSRPEKPTYDD